MTDLAGAERDVARELSAHAERARADLGDARTGVKGAGIRPVGEVDNPVRLTTYHPDHPYFIAEYDLADRG